MVKPQVTLNIYDKSELCEIVKIRSMLGDFDVRVLSTGLYYRIQGVTLKPKQAQK